MTTLHQPHWQDRAIAHSEIISDALEVAKAWGARCAEWILVLCLVANLLELLSFFSGLFGDSIVIIQSITLDIAGFGLTSMGSHARRRGDERSARTASRMGWTLIGLMIITVLVVTLPKELQGLLPPKPLTQVTDLLKWADITLILIRMIVTVFYSHIVHSLRQAGMEYTNEVTGLREEVNELEAQVTTLHTQANTSQQTIETLRSQLDTKQCEIVTLQQQLESAHGQADLMTTKAAHLEQQVTDLTSTITDLRGQLQEMTSSGQQEVTRGQDEVTAKRSGHKRSTGQVSSEEVRSQEVNRSQGQVLPFVPRQQEGRHRHDPLEVKVWCEQHAELSQAEQAAQLGISDAANLRRLLRKARELLTS